MLCVELQHATTLGDVSTVVHHSDRTFALRNTCLMVTIRVGGWVAEWC